MESEIRIMGISGPSGSGKTSVSISLCRSYDVIYCGVGRIFLAITQLIKQMNSNQFNSWITISDKQLARLISQLNLKLVSNCAGDGNYSSVELYQGTNQVHVQRGSNVKDVIQLNRVPGLHPSILEFIQRRVHELTTDLPIIVDGRQTPRIAQSSIYLTADALIRAQRIGMRERLSIADAMRLIEQRDQDDEFINSEARVALEEQFIDTTNLNEYEVLAIVERHFGFK